MMLRNGVDIRAEILVANPPLASKLARLHFSPDQLDDERLVAQKCRQGNAEALAELREKNHSVLTNILLSRGASQTEADDLLADLWTDCVPGNDDRPSLLEKFSGKCSLRSWLATVVTRRWIDLKRKLSRRATVNQTSLDPSEEDALARLPALEAEASENALVNMLRESLRAAFAVCPPESMVLLRLVYLHGLTQREIVRMLHWHESKVSRTLSEAMNRIEGATLQNIKRLDPMLELTWQDFLDLCETEQVGFL